MLSYIFHLYLPLVKCIAHSANQKKRNKLGSTFMFIYDFGISKTVYILNKKRNVSMFPCQIPLNL